MLFYLISTISQKFNSCVTYGPTYIRTDTPSYRDARKHLKIAQGKFQLQAGDWPPKRYPTGLLMTSWKCFAPQWHHIYRPWWTPIVGPQIIWNISVPSWIFFTNELPSCQSFNLNIAKILGSKAANNTYGNTGPLAHPFARSLAPLTPLLAPDCSLCSRPPLRSLVCSLAHFAHSLARGEVNFGCLKITWFCPIVHWPNIMITQKC